MTAPIRLALAAVFALAFGFADSDGCGFQPDDRKAEGEPCTRSSECEVGLECRGGVCMSADEPRDAGPPPSFDAGQDAGEVLDASADGAVDADVTDAALALPDGSTDGAVDGSADGGGPD